jgi:hypothetical protein
LRGIKELQGALDHFPPRHARITLQLFTETAFRILCTGTRCAGWHVSSYNRSLQLETFKGTMELEYVGAMAENAGEDLAGASVFRIKNADGFFQQNRDHDKFCEQPVRWVALNSKTGAPMWSAEISLALLTIEDWSQYTPEVQGYCGGGTYVRDAQ